MPLNCEEFAFDLRDNYSVLLAAGKWHGLEWYVRFGYDKLTYYMKGGLDRIAKYFIKLLLRHEYQIKRTKKYQPYLFYAKYGILIYFFTYITQLKDL